MVWGVLADLVVMAHAAFVVFVLAGGLLVARWSWVAWLHLPAVVWAVGIEWGGGVCPLTPLENALRARGGLSTYEGGFVVRYLEPVLYPVGLTRRWQFVLGAVALAVNLAAYWAIGRRRQGRP